METGFGDESHPLGANVEGSGIAQIAPFTTLVVSVQLPDGVSRVGLAVMDLDMTKIVTLAARERQVRAAGLHLIVCLLHHRADVEVAGEVLRMFDQIKAAVLAKGEAVLGGDPVRPSSDSSLVDHYAQLINECVSAMNEAWCDAPEAGEGEDRREKRDSLSKEIAKVLCSVAAFGYSFGFPMEEIVERVIREGEALRSPMFADGAVL